MSQENNQEGVNNPIFALMFIVLAAAVLFSIVMVAVEIVSETSPGSRTSLGNAISEQYGDSPTRDELDDLMSGRRALIEVEGEQKVIEYTGLRNGEPQFELTGLAE